MKPDLAHSLNVDNQYIHNPKKQLMNQVMCILRYLKFAFEKKILSTKNTNFQNIKVYTNTDQVGSIDDRQSTSGYFTFVDSNLFTWRSKKHIARSSTEAKFRGMTLGLYETLWLRLLFQDLGYSFRHPIQLYCDSKVVCDIAHNLV